MSTKDSESYYELKQHKTRFVEDVQKY
jgi:hypothetical protein